jgi:hypothetical protein
VGSRSSDRPANCLIERSRKQGSIAMRFTSPIRSSTSNGSRAGSGASTKNQAHAISLPAAPGWRQSCGSLGRAFSFASARPPRRRFLVRRFASRASAENCSHPTSRRGLSRPSIPPHSCDSQTKSRAGVKLSSLPQIAMGLQICGWFALPRPPIIR